MAKYVISLIYNTLTFPKNKVFKSQPWDLLKPWDSKLNQLYLQYKQGEKTK